MAPTTLLGQITSTTPNGRNVDLNGYPLKITELIAQLPGAAYVTRQSVHTPGLLEKQRKPLKKHLNFLKKILVQASWKLYLPVIQDGR